MIKSIRLKNFFSFQDTRIDLNDKTNLLIGINGSGKSNLFRAIRLLYQTTIKGGISQIMVNNWGGFDEVRFFGYNENEDIELTYEFDGSKIGNYPENSTLSYTIVIQKVPGPLNFILREELNLINDSNNPDNKEMINNIFHRNGSNLEINKHSEAPQQPGEIETDRILLRESEPVFSHHFNHEKFKQLINLIEIIKDMAYDYDFRSDHNSNIRKPVSPTGDFKLVQDGGNLAQILSLLLFNHRNNYELILSLLNSLNSKYSYFEFHYIGNNIELTLREAEFSKSINITHISDGTLRFLCLMSIFYNPKRGSLVCIDLPEEGLHPDMISVIGEAIKFAAVESQLIIITHSALLLNCFELENVIVLEKDEKNSTIVKKYNEDDLKNNKVSGTLGEMWNQGDLGGKRW